MRLLVAAGAVMALAGCSGAAPPGWTGYISPSAQAMTVCHATGRAPFTRPDSHCTPGAFRELTRAQVCTHKDHPYLPAAARSRIVLRYGVQRWSGASGELDHRVPVFLGGVTSARNVWPERGPATNNPKDALERYVWSRVCQRGSMSVQFARRIFLGDWVRAYRRYLGDA